MPVAVRRVGTRDTERGLRLGQEGKGKSSVAWRHAGIRCRAGKESRETSERGIIEDAVPWLLQLQIFNGITCNLGRKQGAGDCQLIGIEGGCRKEGYGDFFAELHVEFALLNKLEFF